jgi:DNA-binding transcriptional LysR family regulator
MESATPETLLALARAGHGVAIVPTTARIDTRSLRLVPISFRRKLLTAEMAVLWDGRYRLPRYAEGFGAVLAAHMRTVMPQFGPTKAGGSVKRR